jgi:hypothetical protein
MDGDSPFFFVLDKKIHAQQGDNEKVALYFKFWVNKLILYISHIEWGKGAG